ncbi:ACP S-malonyltransferase [Candidatus Gottesmanbacteria bacterium]|nr:ACP S-malonyltransferase [Candidatus Gottesmanbacteria bacterium]
MQQRELAFISPGQGPAIASAWQSDSAAGQVIISVQRAVPEIDVGKLLTTSPSEREISALNSHILLAVMMGIASERLKPVIKGREYVATGHSAGLTNSLGMTEFFKDGSEGLGRAMVERGRLLTQAQSATPGEMFMVDWKGGNGFQEICDWVNEVGNIWLACFNLENGEEANVVMTQKQGSGMDKQIVKTFGDKVKVTPLPIALGAHSPLVLSVAEEYHKFLESQLQGGKIQHTSESGVEYVSDHLLPGKEQPLYSREPEEIIFDLSQVHHPVQFQKAIEFMVKVLGVKRIVELGSRNFAGIIGKMGLGIETISVRNPRELDALVAKFANYDL